MMEFKENIIPGNYFLTKSMEFTRESVSGTLWYLKKYLVLYYNIFLTDGVSTEDGINNIINIFENFIDSLPQESQADATKFFFPNEVNIKNNYNRFINFKGNRMFTNKSEENEYISIVKKYYFVYLMQIGGQSGVKRYIREQLYNPEFNMEKIDDIINTYLIQHPENRYNITQIKNDYHASLRNERQILWYYGFVHSKTTGSSDTEFSSLTPVGEAAIYATYDEFRIIWEQQKLKMISQPVTVLFSGIEGNLYANGDKFYLNYSPYVTILNYLLNRESISRDEYQYIVSRINNNNIKLINNIDELTSNINEIKEQVRLFNRASDYNSEDFDKELKKYILGIRDDLSKDYNKNLFGMCSYRNGVILNNKELLRKILKVYNQIDEYKLNKYGELFNSCQAELRKKYTLQTRRQLYNVNAKTKINWDLYNIHLDKVIIVALILTDYALKNKINLEAISLSNEEIKDIKRIYNRLLTNCNLNKIKDLSSAIKIISIAISNGELKNVGLENDVYEYTYVNEYTQLDVTDLKEKIKRISNESVKINRGRVRNIRLINLIKALYNSIYSDNQKLIKCECCGKTTFLTLRDEAYLEYHHLLPFNIVDGPDHYINIYGICPDCHRRIHYGKEELKEEIYKHFDENNHLNKTILERFKFLYDKNLLKSYQLEYALAEHIIDELQYNQILY